MKTLVEGIWCLIGFGAFLAVVNALTALGADYHDWGWIMLGMLVLLFATWHTHWKR